MAWAIVRFTSRQYKALAAVAPDGAVSDCVGPCDHRRFDARRFFVYVHGGLIVSGAGLVWQAIVTWTAHRAAAH